MTIKPAGGPRSEPAPESMPASPWPARARLLASLLIVLHLAAVFIAPLDFACRSPGSASPLTSTLMGWLRPYVNFLYLNHGYAFFAPDPGPSHLVRYRIEFDNGREPVEGIFPDLQTQRPRLLYHRHFMLAETLYNSFTPPEEPDEMRLDPELAALLTDSQRRQLEAAIHGRHREQVTLWKHSRVQYEMLRHSVERHLAAVHGDGRVTLTRLEHGLLTPEEFVLLGRLDVPHTLRELPESRPAPEVIRP